MRPSRNGEKNTGPWFESGVRDASLASCSCCRNQINHWVSSREKAAGLLLTNNDMTIIE
ncbi:hypothetical protein [Vibrio gazogenes]|uniref:hypothetical protein n=1 Tax=Vibrio gazogenes TaxID=687 RepID=UPI0012FD3663|nr:hypothetical protein [Vibrio gazogenes]